MQISVSDIVRSTAGHDKGEIFFVVGCGNGFVQVANGKTRKVEKPKTKKVIHVRLEKSLEGPVSDKIRNGEIVSNIEIRKALAVYKQGLDEMEGGMHLG